MQGSQDRFCRIDGSKVWVVNRGPRRESSSHTDDGRAGEILEKAPSIGLGEGGRRVVLANSGGNSGGVGKVTRDGALGLSANRRSISHWEGTDIHRIIRRIHDPQFRLVGRMHAGVVHDRVLVIDRVVLIRHLDVSHFALFEVQIEPKLGEV